MSTAQLPRLTPADFRKGAFWMVISLGCFTGNAMLLKYVGAVRGVSAWWALLFRAVVGIMVVWVWFAPRQLVNFKRAACSRLLVSRGILGAFGTAAYYLTLPVLGAGKATLIGNTWVIWAAIMAVPFLGEHLTLRKVIGTLLALGGIVLLTGLQGGDFSQMGLYELIALGGAFVAAGTVVVIRQLTRTETSATIFASQCIYTCLLALPFIFGTRMPDGVEMLLLILAATTASFGQLAMTEGFRFLAVSSGGAFQVLLPLSITFGSVTLFDEAFSMAQ
ncbi:MAG: DMT family transporter, partial [Prosthecobacter sp.]|nr:DMT family transporter [Prosthecobacter sp.]